MIKKCLLIVICLIGLTVPRLSAQTTLVLSIDSIVNLNPLIMGGTTDFRVQVRVDNVGGPDTMIIFGDIYYYYLTDSMMSVGDTARIFEQDFFGETVYDGFFDTVHVDIQPNEIHSSPPMNLIVIWPAMVHPEVVDTDSATIYLPLVEFEGMPSWYEAKGNIIFPSPAMTFLYIKPKEIDKITEMIITNMLGQEMQNIPGVNLSTGWVNIDELNPGTYMAILRYKNGTTTSMKFLKE